MHVADPLVQATRRHYSSAPILQIHRATVVAGHGLDRPTVVQRSGRLRGNPWDRADSLPINPGRIRRILMFWKGVVASIGFPFVFGTRKPRACIARALDWREWPSGNGSLATIASWTPYCVGAGGMAAAHDPGPSTETGSGYVIGLVTIALVFAVSLGWLGGFSLYDWFHCRAPESADKTAISALIERIVAEPNRNQKMEPDIIDATKSREGRRDESKNPVGYVIGN